MLTVTTANMNTVFASLILVVFQYRITASFQTCNDEGKTLNVCDWALWPAWDCSGCHADLHLAIRIRKLCCETGLSEENCIQHCGYHMRDMQSNDSCTMHCPLSHGAQISRSVSTLASTENVALSTTELRTVTETLESSKSVSPLMSTKNVSLSTTELRIVTETLESSHPVAPLVSPENATLSTTELRTVTETLKSSHPVAPLASPENAALSTTELRTVTNQLGLDKTTYHRTANVHTTKDAFPSSLTTQYATPWISQIKTQNMSPMSTKTTTVISNAQNERRHNSEISFTTNGYMSSANSSDHERKTDQKETVISFCHALSASLFVLGTFLGGAGVGLVCYIVNRRSKRRQWAKALSRRRQATVTPESGDMQNRWNTRSDGVHAKEHCRESQHIHDTLNSF